MRRFLPLARLCAFLAGCQAPLVGRAPLSLGATAPVSGEAAPGEAAPGLRHAATAPAATPPARAQGDITLNFQEAPLEEVARTILGDILGENFVIDPGLAGNISLATEQKLDRDELLPLLDQLLAARGLSLGRADGVWRISAGAPARAAPEGEIAVFRPAYLPAEDLAGLLSALVPPEQVRAVEKAGLVAVAGSPAELARARRAIATLDIDPLAGSRVLLLGLKEARASDLAAEMEAVLGGSRVVALERLNALLVIAPDSATLARAEDWARRLDAASAEGERRLHMYRVQNRKAADMATALGGLGEGSIKLALDEPNNALLVEADGPGWRRLSDLLRQMDVTPRQVLIEATILEVDLNDALRFGVQYAIDTGSLLNAQDSVLAFSATAAGLPLTPTLPGFAFALGGARPDAIIEALDSKTDIHVVSAPKLLVLDNQIARLQVGDSVPIVTQTTTQATTGTPLIVNAIQYRNTGVTLEVTPRVSENGLVTLDVVQEVSDVARTTSSNIDSPTIQQRRMLTAVAVNSGQTVMLGGLIRERRDNADSGVPLLMDLPAPLGNAFKTSNRGQRRTELLALLTPHVLLTPAAAHDLSTEIRALFEDAGDRHLH